MISSTSDSKQINYSFFRNFVTIGLGRLATQFIGFLLLPVYTFNMTSDSYGQLDLTITIGSLVIPLLTLHLELAAFRFLIDRRRDEKATVEIVRTVMIAVSAQMLVAVAATLSLTYLLFNQFMWTTALYLAFMVPMGSLLQIARGVGNNVLYAAGSFVVAFSTLLGTVFFVIYLNMSVDGALLSLACGNVVGSVFLTCALSPVRTALAGKKYGRAKLRPLVKYSLPLIPNSISWWVISGMDRIIILVFLSLSDLGIFAYATRISSILTVLATIYSLTWSESASLHVEDKREKNQAHLVLISSIFGILCAIVIVSLGLFLPMVTPIEYMSSMQYVPPLVVGSLFYAFTTFFGGLYIAGYNSKGIGLTSIGAAILKLILALVLIPLVGLWGAALSTVIAFAGLASFRYFDLRRMKALKNLPKKEASASLIVVLLSILLFYFAAQAVLVIALVLFLAILVYWSIRPRITAKIGRN